MSSYRYTIPPIKMPNSLSSFIKSNSSKANNSRLSNNASNSVSGRKINGSIFKYILLIIIILITLFIAFYILYYIFYDCYEKKSLGEYLFDMKLQPCVYEYNPKSFAERKVADEEEVFNIANQIYTYEQAKCKCAALGARMATREEVIDAYNHGADWCVYSWTDGGFALYPTQKCTWDELQLGDPKHRNDCGQPGVNGGIFDQNLKFGINCFGVKPKGVIEKPPYCKEKDFCKMKVNRFANIKSSRDVISPFNNNQWSKFV